METQNKNNLIQEISIKNFRVFKDAHFKNFKRVNLFSGRNDIGKTYLLEAITAINGIYTLF